MHTNTRKFQALCIAMAFLCLPNLPAVAQDDVVELTLHPMAVPSNPDSSRLLPRENELRDGNAAIELLRMPWEQSNFIALKAKLMNDWLEMKETTLNSQNGKTLSMSSKRKCAGLLTHVTPTGITHSLNSLCQQFYCQMCKACESTLEGSYRYGSGFKSPKET